MKYIRVFHPAGVAARSKSAPGGFVSMNASDRGLSSDLEFDNQEWSYADRKNA